MILLVDGDHHSDGYVIVIVVNANKILVLLNQEAFCQSRTPLYLDFAGNDWPDQQSQGELFA